MASSAPATSSSNTERETGGGDSGDNSLFREKRCGCVNCTCGINDCQCTETLCRCAASDVIDSVKSHLKSCCNSDGDTKKGIKKQQLLQKNEEACDPLANAAAPHPETSTEQRNILNEMKEEDDGKIYKNKVELWIEGMTCSMCSQAIERAVRGMDESTANGMKITNCSVSLATDTAVVEWSRPIVNPVVSVDDDVETIQLAIQDIGYTVEQVLMLSSTACTSSTSNSSHSRGAASNAASSPSRPSIGTRTTATVPVETVDTRWERLMERQQRKVRQRRNAFLWSLLGAVPVLIETMLLPHIAPGLVKMLQERHVSIPFFFSNSQRYASLESLLLWIAATPVQFICGWDFYKMSYHNLRTGRAGMDVLVALGTTASYVYALYGSVFESNSSGGGGHENGMHTAHFFETAVTLIAFVLAGKWMQALAVRRTSQALTKLMQLQAKVAIKVTPFKDRQNFHPITDPYMESTVAIEDVREGDLVKIIMGASIPADGRVVFGEVTVDESMITGESMPVLKTTGSLVLGGTVCVETSRMTPPPSIDGNEDNDNVVDAEAANNINDPVQRDRNVGAAFVHVTGVGAQTALAQIVQLVQDAQTRSVPIQSFADQIAAIFVPTVCAISLFTYLVWYALCSAKVVPEEWYKDLGEDPATFSIMFGIACLVISCPCALGLATPTAVMVGVAKGANCGVLMKGGEALEVASKVDTIVFDKTGTLTKGMPVITDFFQLEEPELEPEEDVTMRDHLLWLFASLERTSEHPLARAIVAYAEMKLDKDFLRLNPFFHPTNFHALTGRGAYGTIDGDVSVAVGNRTFAATVDLRIPRIIEECMVSLEDEGKTAVLAAVNGKVCVVMGIADELKPDAASSITYLKERMGADVWLVTGDNSRTASAISKKLGLPANRVISEALPSAKVNHVRRLQKKGHVVAMVGDGVNDSPALAQADVGISVGTGAEIAAEASDMVLVKGHVADVCTALHLSRVIFRRIQWNLLWSLLYNCLGIPIAAGACFPFVHTRLPPTVAALAMALSSISVVLSSLSLRLYRPPDLNPAQHHRRLRRREPTSVWTRALRQLASRQPGTDNDAASAYVNLLENDHLTGSSEMDLTESTRIIDNRSTSNLDSHLESGDLLSMD